MSGGSRERQQFGTKSNLLRVLLHPTRHLDEELEVLRLLGWRRSSIFVYFLLNFVSPIKPGCMGIDGTTGCIVVCEPRDILLLRILQGCILLTIFSCLLCLHWLVRDYISHQHGPYLNRGVKRLECQQHLRHERSRILCCRLRRPAPGGVDQCRDICWKSNL